MKQPKSSSRRVILAYLFLAALVVCAFLVVVSLLTPKMGVFPVVLTMSPNHR